MRFDFRSVDDVESFVTVPPGQHNVRIAEVREGRARDGSVRWTYRLEVLDGDHAGRTAAWDSLTWSERGVHRVKKVLEALGLDVGGELEIESGDLVGLQARVLVQPEERENPLSGKRQVRMRVPYLGYVPHTDDHSASDRPAVRESVDGRHRDGEPDGDAQPEGDDDLPF